MTEEHSAKGWAYTHWDCPECQASNETEGDIKGETVECEACYTVVLIE